jgi:hypothetical protein
LGPAFLAIAVLTGGPSASAAPVQACERLLVTPQRPTAGEVATLRVRLLGHLGTAAATGPGGETAVELRASLTGPGEPTVPLRIQQSAFDSRSFRSRFRVVRPGAWHVRVLVFAAGRAAQDTDKDPLCYGSWRFVVLRAAAAPPPPDRGGFPAGVLPILGLVPIVIAVSLLMLSGRGHRA